MRIHINSVPLEVEVADTPGLHKQGLMNRDSVAGGMLFKYPSEQGLSFWMRNTRVPLSIAFISKTGHINFISHMQPHDETAVTGHGMYALEVPKGWFEQNNIARGHMVDMGMDKTAQLQEYIDKAKASVDNTLLSMGSSTPAFRMSMMGTGLGSSLIAALLVHRNLKNTMEDTARATAAQRAGLKRSFSELRQMPVKKLKGFNNAAFVDAASLDEIGPLDAKTRQQAIKAGGMVVYDPDFAKPGILAHEYGHAQIDREGGFGRFNQRWLRPAGMVASLAAPAAGITAGMHTASPIKGLAAGLGVGALALAPTVYNEFSASRKARKWLDSQKKMSGPQQDANRSTLSSALRTYWVPGVAGVAAVSALAGLIGKRYNEGTVWSGLPKADL